MAVCQISTDYTYWGNRWNFFDTEESIKRLYFWDTAQNLDNDEVDSNLMISTTESLAQAENESRSGNILIL